MIPVNAEDGSSGSSSSGVASINTLLGFTVVNISIVFTTFGYVPIDGINVVSTTGPI